MEQLQCCWLREQPTSFGQLCHSTIPTECNHRSPPVVVAACTLVCHKLVGVWHPRTGLARFAVQTSDTLRWCDFRTQCSNCHVNIFCPSESWRLGAGQLFLVTCPLFASTVHRESDSFDAPDWYSSSELPHGHDSNLAVVNDNLPPSSS